MKLLQYKQHPVMAASYGLMFDYNPKYLERNLQVLENMLECHNKVFVFRMDIRFPVHMTLRDPNGFITWFMDRFVKLLTREKLDPAYVVRKERETSETPHFHCFILLDGNKARGRWRWVKMAEELLARYLGIPVGEVKGLIYHDVFQKMIRRGDPDCGEAFDEVYREMSYLAKLQETDICESSERKFFRSNLKKAKVGGRPRLRR